MREIITIRISKYLTNELAKEIAVKEWNSDAPQWVNRTRQCIFRELVNDNDCFEVVATTAYHEVVGRLHCIQNKAAPALWYYGDLFVTPAYRRMGIAKQMIHAAITHLSEMGAVTLRCYVDPNNVPSRSLQAAVGFTEQPYKTFNNLTNDGEIMYEIDIPNCLSVIPATVHEANFVRILFVQNQPALHMGNIRLNDWRERLSAAGLGEKHFLICKGAMPVAYMELDGLLNKKEARISLLFVAKGFQRRGIGSFAIHFAEQYVKENGIDVIKAQTDEGNPAAENCFLKCGYTISRQNTEMTFCKML